MSDDAPRIPGAPAAAGRSSRRRLPVILGILVVGALIGFVATRPLGGTAGPATGSPGGSAPAGTGTLIGQSAPDFVGSGGTPLLAGMDGSPIRLADFAGRPLWIVFWATWCIPCQEEAADIVAAYHDHRDAGLAILAIDVQEPTAAVRDFVAQHGIDYQVGLDASGEARALYGGWGLPVHFFVDRSGVIRDRSIGQLHRSSMEERLQSILP
jgi:cytochrome c biogenesis protein CcmG, thiol:disulfide interchange protein DsbE